MERFKNKTIAITGGASGLGLEASKKFLIEGGNVVVLDVDLKSLKDIKKNFEFKKYNNELIGIKCDVSKEDEVEKSFEKIVSIFKKIDILHANAGIGSKPCEITEIKLEEWNKIISVNLTGIFLSSKYALKQMVKQKYGNIVITGSNWAYVCDEGYAGYVASKGGVVAFGRAMALEYAKYNIRTNIICPGNMYTPQLINSLKDEKNPEEILNKMGKISKPEDVANLVLFLASEDSSPLKGSVIMADQGETLQYGPGLKSMLDKGFL